MRIALIVTCEFFHANGVTVPPGQQGRARRGTDRLRVKVVVQQPGGRQCVDVRSGDLGAEALQVGEPCVVQHNINDIRAVRPCLSGARRGGLSVRGGPADGPAEAGGRSSRAGLLGASRLRGCRTEHGSTHPLAAREFAKHRKRLYHKISTWQCKVLDKSSIWPYSVSVSAPVSLGSRAAENLRYIRETMQEKGRAASRPCRAAEASPWDSRPPRRPRGAASNDGAGISGRVARRSGDSFAIGIGAVRLKARATGEALWSKPARKFALAFAPPIAAGGVLTIALWRAGAGNVIPGTWLALYGVAVMGAGAFSVAVVPAMGVSFLSSAAWHCCTRLR